MADIGMATPATTVNPAGYGGGMSGVDILKAGTQILNTAVGTYSPYAQLSLEIERAGRQKAAGIYQRGLNEVQAIDTLAIAEIRADQSIKIASLQAGRRLEQAKIEARNYQIQGNRILQGLRAANAAVRARAAANGVAVGQGSAGGIEVRNAQVAAQDMGITDLNALMARVMGFEDATNIYIAGRQTANFETFVAQRQAAELRLAGDFAEKSGGLLSGATMVQGGMEFVRNFQNPFPTIAKAFE